MEKYLVAGGAGFIGSHFVDLVLASGAQVVVLDALTYAGNSKNLLEASTHKNYRFVHGSINDLPLVKSLIADFRPDRVVNFAAESHVDNSISGPELFVQTNVLGTFYFLEASRAYWQTLTDEAKKRFLYLQISTDEVFGELGDEGAFTESTPYDPNSPYSATKAGGDHLVRAWMRTYGMPTMITNCSNNYGPRQFQEKLIPLMISKALAWQPLPVYGTGANVRDWIHVEDHCQGILLALQSARAGATYCFGGRSERCNLDVVKTICKTLDQMKPNAKGSHEQLISFVTDRLGHDHRYAIDDTHAQNDLGFARKYANLEAGLKDTIRWYLDHPDWFSTVKKGAI
jgi:dTDP-glucose 4,6-dehydratase